LTGAIDRRIAIEKRGADLHCRYEEWLTGRVWHRGSIGKTDKGGELQRRRAPVNV
jgi:hypothetical protein